MEEPAWTLISVKRVLQESNGIPLSPTCAAAFTRARVLEIAVTGSSPPQETEKQSRRERGGRLKERDKQMSALVGDAGEVRRAGLCRQGAERRLIGAGRSVRVRDQRMQPLISLLLALIHLLMELHGSDTAVYLEKLTPETNL